MKHFSAVYIIMIAGISLFSAACQNGTDPDENMKDTFAIQLITLDPGHFHAALVQKEMYPQVDSIVHVYAPGGKELDSYLSLISLYNERKEDPTHWKQIVYTGNDFLEKMLEERKGNVVVLAGNNRNKTGYINQSIDAGINVLADKPMAINKEDFDLLVSAFDKAGKNGLLLYDIMTERSEITNILQKELAQRKDIFGDLEEGTPANPAIVMENVHYFFKQVSGKPLLRPAWFFDPVQEGEAIADVGTHLVDLVQWECFPEMAIDYKKDIEIHSSKLWPTPLTLKQFENITNQSSFPDYLMQYVSKDSLLLTHANGEINYSIKGKYAKVTTRWDYQAEEGGDTHYSILRGTKADLMIRQGKEEQFKPTLYIFPSEKNRTPEYKEQLKESFSALANSYQGIELKEYKTGWIVNIPEKYKVGHEAHFAEVMERYLLYMKDGSMPAWEIPNMIAKYYTTTQSLEKASAIRK